MATTTTGLVEGRVIQISGPAVDIQFPESQIPVINTAIHITSEGYATEIPIDVMVEVAQHIANHESPRTTKLYDRRQDEISLDEIERIAI